MTNQLKETNNVYMTAAEVSVLLGISIGKSYQIIRNMNEELKSMGFITIAGKVPRKFANQKLYI